MGSERKAARQAAGRAPVVVERLLTRHRPVLWWYRFRGHPIFYLHAQPTVAPWVQTTGWLKQLDLQEPLYWGNHPGGDEAFATVEREYPEVSGHPLIRYLVALYQSSHAHLAFMKSLCATRERQAYYRILRRRIADSLGERPWVFIPASPNDDAGAVRLLAGVSPGWPQTPWWTTLTGLIGGLFERMVWIALAMVTLARGLAVFVAPHPPQRSRWAFAIAIVSPAREFANDVRGAGFLLDDQNIRRENTVFIPVVRLPRRARHVLRGKGLRLLDPGPGTRATLRPIAAGAVRVLRHAGAEPWMLRAAAHLLREYGQWSAFIAEHHVDHFISYADFSLRQIARNILLRRDGTATWYYADSVNTAGTLSGNPHRNSAWGWLYYDTFVSWSQPFTDYFRLHPQQIGRFVEVGCLWSEHARLLKAGSILSDLPARLPWARGAVRVLAVFDSTYRDDTVTTYHDGAEFACGILRLLEERPDVAVVWKEKKPRGYHRGRDAGALMEAYERLACHPRCLFTGHEVSASEPLAVCDLAISFPFSSPTLEALGAGVKAIFFDPTGKYRDSYYAGVEGLVAHGYAELRQRVDELIDHTPPEAFQAYLERHIKGAIDPYVDGFALSRFRALLVGGRLAGGVPAVMRS